MARKIILTLLTLLCSGMVWAEEQSEINVGKPGVDSLYVQLFAGINKSANENMPWTEFTQHPMSAGVFVGLGREFNRLWGWRIVFGIDGNKSRNVPDCESPETWGWADLEGWGDLTFDITDALRGSKKESGRFNLKAFAGIGGLYTFAFPQRVVLSYSEPYSRNSTVNLGLRAGLTATYQVSRQWKVGAELSHLFAADQFNGVNDNKGMDMRSNLKVGVMYMFASKQRRPTEPVIMAHRLRDIPVLTLRGVEPEQTKERKLVGRSFLDFPVNMTDIYPKYRRNPEELKRIYDTIEKAMFDKSIKITSIQLHGYASPESPYTNNTRLAKGRVAALARHLQEHYKLSASLFVQEYTPEDWDNLRSYIADNDRNGGEDSGLRRTVKTSIWYDNDNVIETPVMPDMVYNHRDELLSVIDSGLEPDAKEEALKRVGNGAPYRWLLDNVYPGLRHTDYVITYVANNYSVAEGRKLIYTHPEAMSMEEMYNVAASYPRRSDDWYEAIMTAAKLNPENETAHLNAAIACIEMRRLKDARKHLQLVNDPEADYLFGVIGAMEGTVNWSVENGKVVVWPK